MRKIKYRISTNSKLRFISVIIIIISSITFIISPYKTISTISFFIGLTLFIITCILNFKQNKLDIDLLNEMNHVSSSIPENKWNVIEKEYTNGNTKIKHTKKIYHSKNNISENFFNVEDVNNLEEIKKIIICPNCGAKNIVNAHNSKCKYCDAYIE